MGGGGRLYLSLFFFSLFLYFILALMLILFPFFLFSFLMAVFRVLAAIFLIPRRLFPLYLFLLLISISHYNYLLLSYLYCSSRGLNKCSNPFFYFSLYLSSFLFLFSPHHLFLSSFFLTTGCPCHCHYHSNGTAYRQALSLTMAQLPTIDNH